MVFWVSAFFQSDSDELHAASTAASVMKTTGRSLFTVRFLELVPGIYATVCSVIGASGSNAAVQKWRYHIDLPGKKARVMQAGSRSRSRRAPSPAAPTGGAETGIGRPRDER